MFTILLFSILAAIVVGSPPGNGAAEAALGLTLLTSIVLPVLLAGLSVLLHQKRPLSDRAIDHWIRAHATIWAALAIGLTYIGHWPEFVRSLPMLSSAILVDELLILAPVLLGWMLSWLLFTEFFRSEAGAHPQWRWRFVANQLRLTLLLAWAPCCYSAD